MKKTYTICLMITGGITVEAESEDEARAYLDSEDGQEAIGSILAGNDITVTEIYEEK